MSGVDIFILNLPIEAKKRLQNHRFIPKHRPGLPKYAKFWRVRDIIGERRIVNVDYDSSLQNGEYFQIEKWHVSVYLNDMS